jgi:nitrate reductase NapE component
MEGKFCEKCGAPAPGPAAPAPAPAAPMMAAAAQPSAAPKKKTSPLVWILLGVLGLIVLSIVSVVMVGGYFVHKATKNPAMAAARMMMMGNPDVEIVSADDDTGILTVRDKKTGKTVTMNASDIKNGKLTFSDDSTGDKVSVGGTDLTSLPEWVPVYPGAKSAGTVASTNKGGIVQLTTSDAAERVVSFYDEHLRQGGFEVEKAELPGTNTVKGTDNGNNRIVAALITGAGGATHITLTYGVKE